MLCGVLRRIGNYSVEGFQNRLKLQKTVYLLQAFGIYLGYEYNWYLYGPYSPGLARDAYEVSPRLGLLEPVRFADDETEMRFQVFTEFLGEYKDDPQWLELVASLHMLNRVYEGKNQKDIFRRMAKKQPYLTEANRLAAWNHLQDFGLVTEST